MPDNDQLSPEQKERLRVFRWLRAIHKHSIAKLKDGGVWNLAARRSILRMVGDNSNELASEPLLISIAREFDQSLVNGNGDFLRAVARADDALERDDFFEKLNIQTQSLLIYEELCQALEKRPTTQQVLKRLKETLKTPPDKRQEDRAMEALVPLCKQQ